MIPSDHDTTPNASTIQFVMNLLPQILLLSFVTEVTAGAAITENKFTASIQME